MSKAVVVDIYGRRYLAYRVLFGQSFSLRGPGRNPVDVGITQKSRTQVIVDGFAVIACKPVIDDAGVVQVVGERVFFRCIGDTCNQLWDRDIVIIHAVFGADEAQNTKNGRGNDDTSGASKKCIAGAFHCYIAFLAFYHKSYGAEKCYHQQYSEKNEQDFDRHSGCLLVLLDLSG